MLDSHSTVIPVKSLKTFFCIKLLRKIVHKLKPISILKLIMLSNDHKAITITGFLICWCLNVLFIQCVS